MKYFFISFIRCETLFSFFYFCVVSSRLNGQMNSSFANFLLIICCLCTVTDTAKLREGCEPLLKSIWLHLCNGVITKEIKIKYKDQLTTVGTPYKIMSLEKQKTAFLITFFDSDLQNCTWIDINENMTVTCARKKQIQSKPTMFYCFNFGLEYLNDLMNLCFDQADSLASLKSHCIFTVLHYSYMPPLVAAQVRLNADCSYVFGFVMAVVFMSVICVRRNRLWIKLRSSMLLNRQT